MFDHTYYNGLLSVLYSVSKSPLNIWDKKSRDGQIKRILDEDIASPVLEIIGANIGMNYITCPEDAKRVLGIRLPYFVMLTKNMKSHFIFEIQILDDRNIRRRFRFSNFQKQTRVSPFICTVPLRMEDSWVRIELNLADLTKRVYGTRYVETIRIQVYANCRLRRIYFADRAYKDDELPKDFKITKPKSEEQCNNKYLVK